jgi:DNA-binding beta-propeller fold protein YncE
MKQDKEYFAFISYKSEDVEWATWLQHELEHYHLPASFNGRTDVPQELRPVFRDIDELSAGNLPEQIKQALANSQNLIVICSPQAAQSPWVNQEVETFIALGRTNRIFPFIVEGNSPSEFFPPALLNLPKDEERLGGDVSKKGRDAAFVKVVAGMLGVGFDTLWNRYEKEKAEEERKQREQRDRLLISQSRFLAEKANALVEEGDSYTARLLALKALPKDINNPERPYTIEAEKALRHVVQYDNAILRGHINQVNSIAFSPDGKRIVSASHDRTIRIWDARTGKQIGDPLVGHTREVNSAVFSLDGKHIVSASWDKTIRIWDAQTGRQIGNPLEGHTFVVKYASFSSDSKFVVSASYDDTIRIWDAQTGKQTGNPLKGHESGVSSASFSPDGKFIVSGSLDNTVRIWNAQTGKQIGSPLEGHTDHVNSVAFSPDGKHIVSASDDKTVRIWDAHIGKQISNPLAGHADEVNSVAFSPDSKYIVSASSDQTIRIWDFTPLQDLIDEISERFKDRQLTPKERQKYYLD